MPRIMTKQCDSSKGRSFRWYGRDLTTDHTDVTDKERKGRRDGRSSLFIRGIREIRGYFFFPVRLRHELSAVTNTFCVLLTVRLSDLRFSPIDHVDFDRSSTLEFINDRSVGHIEQAVGLGKLVKPLSLSKCDPAN